MAGKAPDDGGIIGGINVTPLVDITLVLLIVFMVTAKLTVSPAVPMELPKASQGEEVQVIFSVLVPLQGPTLVNGRPVVTDRALLEAARLAVAGNPELRAVINADGGVPHRQVIKTLDLLKQAGVSRIAFGAVPEEPVH